MMPEFGTYPLFAFSMDYCVYVQKNALCRAPKGTEFCTTVCSVYFTDRLFYNTVVD